MDHFLYFPIMEIQKYSTSNYTLHRGGEGGGVEDTCIYLHSPAPYSVGGLSGSVLWEHSPQPISDVRDLNRGIYIYMNIYSVIYIYKDIPLSSCVAAVVVC